MPPTATPTDPAEEKRNAEVRRDGGGAPETQPGSGWAILLACLSLLGSGCAAEVNRSAESALPTNVLVSIGPFPYDLTAEAVNRVTGLVRENANLYAVQLDNGIPWEAALAGTPIDAGLMDQWRRHKESIAPHHEVYLAIAPLAEDRMSWAAGFAGGKAPSWALDEEHLTEQLKTAYTRYVLQAVEYFRPAFLNIGVEAGDMAAKRPSKWPLFEALFTQVAAEVHAKHPALKIGISFGLPLLMEKGVLERAQVLIDRSDYVGISFYPYMSAFYARLGAAPLPAPPDEWRKPLEWLSQNVRKPIAMCETAYASAPVTLAQYQLKLGGDPAVQSQYVADLAAIARRDHYLFTVFFLTVDYDALMEKLRPGDETMKLWQRTGFFDRTLAEKPAWSSYRRAWLGRDTAGNLEPPSQFKTVPAAPGARLGFATSKDLFVAPSPDEIWLEGPAGKPSYMRWNYSYRAGQFAWAAREVPPGSGKSSVGLAFELESDRNTPLLLQVEESDGEAFYAVLTPGATWATVKLAWPDFRPDPGKTRNGKLEAERIVKVMLADAAAIDLKATGNRRVDVAEMAFVQ